MTVTAERASFIQQDLRISKVVIPQSEILFGANARKTTEPIPTCIESKADADVLVLQRAAVLNGGRQLSWAVQGEQVGMALNYIGSTPCAQAIDDDRMINAPSRIDEIQINFVTGQTLLETWG